MSRRDSKMPLMDRKNSLLLNNTNGLAREKKILEFIQGPSDESLEILTMQVDRSVLYV